MSLHFGCYVVFACCRDRQMWRWMTRHAVDLVHEQTPSPRAGNRGLGVPKPSLMTTPLSKQWPVPRFAAKSHLPWVDQILDMQTDESDVPNQTACITQVTLEKWSSLTAQEIRSALPSRPGPLRDLMRPSKGSLDFRLPSKGLKLAKFLRMLVARMSLNLFVQRLKDVPLAIS